MRIRNKENIQIFYLYLSVCRGPPVLCSFKALSGPFFSWNLALVFIYLWFDKKPPIVNLQYVVYHFQYVTCAIQVMLAFTLWGTYISAWVNPRICLLPLENIIGINTPLSRKISNKHSSLYNNKFDCLVQEILLIRELTPSLNKSDWIGAKLFAWLCIFHIC